MNGNLNGILHVLSVTQVRHATYHSDNDCIQRLMANILSLLVSKEVFDCQRELRITLSKVYESITIVYEHKGHIETHKFHMTEEVRDYIRAQNRLAPSQIYQNDTNGKRTGI
jgi:hypothetical protein